MRHRTSRWDITTHALRCTLLSAVAMALIVGGCGGAKWFKGNTHTHTVLCGHADSTPEVVARWYLDRGYNFLVLSEHNRFIDPATVKLPADRREDFILIPGEEITGKKVIHTTALNVDGLVPWDFDHEHKHVILQNHVDETRARNGVPIINHPNFKWALQAKDILPVRDVHLLELYNAHPQVNHEGDEEHDGLEALWDTLLTSGMTIYGVSSDDAHHFATWHPTRSNPGRGWTMVRAKRLDADAITAAIEQGDFYASSGVILDEVRVANGHYHVSVNTAETEVSLTSPALLSKHEEDGVEGYRIDAIGPGGQIVASVNDSEATFLLTRSLAYLRIKVTRTVKRGEQYYSYSAWTQPVFSDHRATIHFWDD